MPLNAYVENKKQLLTPEKKCFETFLKEFSCRVYVTKQKSVMTEQILTCLQSYLLSTFTQHFIR